MPVLVILVVLLVFYNRCIDTDFQESEKNRWLHILRKAKGRISVDAERILLQFN
jgi:hypothetical protein